jgi:hypothetical protein
VDDVVEADVEVIGRRVLKQRDEHAQRRTLPGGEGPPRPHGSHEARQYEPDPQTYAPELGGFRLATDGTKQLLEAQLADCAVLNHFDCLVASPGVCTDNGEHIECKLCCHNDHIGF